MKRLQIAFAALLVASSASAAELGDGKLYLNGYGSVGYGRTARNAYAFANEEGGYETRFALAAISRVYDDVVVAASMEAMDDEVDIDWAFVELRASDLFRFRAGEAKHAFGLYSETQDVGTVRPFFTVPMSVYGPVGIAAESYVGAGATGSFRRGGWGLEYDVYGGQLELEVMDLDDVLQPGSPPVPVEEEVDLLKDLVGGRLTLLTPIRGLTVRVSAYRARREEAVEGGAEQTQIVVGPAVEYVTDKTSVRAEYYHLVQGDETADAGYVELARFVGDHVQLAARAEAYQGSYEGVASTSFMRHRELAVGANYWVNPDVVFKASFHAIDGNRFALPELVGPDEAPDDRTWAVLVGTQFTF